jgi:hypothetical protein
MARSLVVVSLFLLSTWTPSAMLPPPASLPPATHGGGPTGAEEKAVHRYILEHAEDPESVEFLRWGPHDLNGELHKLALKLTLKNEAREAAGKFVRQVTNVNDLLLRNRWIVRVSYREKRAATLEVVNRMFFFDGSDLISKGDGLGDNWLLWLLATYRFQVEWED